MICSPYGRQVKKQKPVTVRGAFLWTRLQEGSESLLRYLKVSELDFGFRHASVYFTINAPLWTID
jgi:hypothetical protein